MEITSYNDANRTAKGFYLNVSKEELETIRKALYKSWESSSGISKHDFGLLELDIDLFQQTTL